MPDLYNNKYAIISFSKEDDSVRRVIRCPAPSLPLYYHLPLLRISPLSSLWFLSPPASDFGKHCCWSFELLKWLVAKVPWLVCDPTHLPSVSLSDLNYNYINPIQSGTNARVFPAFVLRPLKNNFLSFPFLSFPPKQTGDPDRKTLNNSLVRFTRGFILNSPTLRAEPPPNLFL